MYPATLIILSEEDDGLFYKVPLTSPIFYSYICSYPELFTQSLSHYDWLQGKLPLNMITVTTPCQDVKPNTFMIEGK